MFRWLWLLYTICVDIIRKLSIFIRGFSVKASTKKVFFSSFMSRDCVALNVYVALCYYKLDYFDVSQEVLSVYLQQFPDSVTAVNLKACNFFKLYNAKAAETELKTLAEKLSGNFHYADDLIKHNLVSAISFIHQPILRWFFVVEKEHFKFFHRLLMLSLKRV